MVKKMTLRRVKPTSRMKAASSVSESPLKNGQLCFRFIFVGLTFVLIVLLQFQLVNQYEPPKRRTLPQVQLQAVGDVKSADRPSTQRTQRLRKPPRAANVPALDYDEEPIPNEALHEVSQISRDPHVLLEATNTAHCRERALLLKAAATLPKIVSFVHTSSHRDHHHGSSRRPEMLWMTSFENMGYETTSKTDLATVVISKQRSTKHSYCALTQYTNHISGSSVLFSSESLLKALRHKGLPLEQFVPLTHVMDHRSDCARFIEQVSTELDAIEGSAHASSSAQAAAHAPVATPPLHDSAASAAEAEGGAAVVGGKSHASHSHASHSHLHRRVLASSHGGGSANASLVGRNVRSSGITLEGGWGGHGQPLWVLRRRSSSHHSSRLLGVEELRHIVHKWRSSGGQHCHSIDTSMQHSGAMLMAQQYVPSKTMAPPNHRCILRAFLYIPTVFPLLTAFAHDEFYLTCAPLSKPFSSSASHHASSSGAAGVLGGGTGGARFVVTSDELEEFIVENKRMHRKRAETAEALASEAADAGAGAAVPAAASDGGGGGGGRKQYLRSGAVVTTVHEELQPAIKRLLASIAESFGPKLKSSKNAGSFGFFGVDMEIDDALHPWLVSIVDSPEMSAKEAGDEAKLGPLFRDVLRELVEMQHEVVVLASKDDTRRHTPEAVGAKAKNFFLVAFEGADDGVIVPYPFW